MQKEIIKKLILCLTLSLSGFAHASSMRIGVSKTSADSLWIGEEDTEFKDNSGTLGERSINIISLTSDYKINDKNKFRVALSYIESKMKEIGFANVSANASRRGIDNIEFRYTHSPLRPSAFIDLDLGLGVRTQGTNKSGNTFIALSDGLTKFDFHLGISKDFGALNISFENRYTHRPTEDAKDQILTSLNLGLMATRKLFFGASFSNFQTFGGFDIGGAGFSGAMGPNFSVVKEAYKATSLTVGYIFNQSSLDLSFSKKISGKNTDNNQSWGGGYSFYY